MLQNQILILCHTLKHNKRQVSSIHTWDQTSEQIHLSPQKQTSFSHPQLEWTQYHEPVIATVNYVLHYGNCKHSNHTKFGIQSMHVLLFNLTVYCQETQVKRTLVSFLYGWLIKQTEVCGYVKRAKYGKSKTTCQMW